jgi:hypothetical protein
MNIVNITCVFDKIHINLIELLTFLLNCWLIYNSNCY